MAAPSFIRTLTTALALLVYPALSRAFDEDFSAATLDTTAWVWVQRDGVLDLAAGRAAVTAVGSTAAFPVLYTRQRFIPSTGDFRVEIRFRFPSVGLCGTGIAGFDSILVHPQFLGLGLWYDSPGIVAYVGDAVPVPLGISPDRDHVYEWQYVDGKYSFLIDEVLVAESVSAVRPHRILFGHPTEVHECGWGWSSQSIDRVTVEAILPTGVNAERELGRDPRIQGANPARGILGFTCSLASPAQLELAVYDVLGRRLRTLADGPSPAGSRRFELGPGSPIPLPAGVYFVRATAGESRTVRRFTLLR